jgi:hypothetical protein
MPAVGAACFSETVKELNKPRGTRQSAMRIG